MIKNKVVVNKNRHLFFKITYPQKISLNSRKMEITFQKSAHFFEKFFSFLKNHKSSIYIVPICWPDNLLLLLVYNQTYQKELKLSN